MSSLLPLRVTIPLPWHFVSFRAVLDLLTAVRIVTTLGPSRLVLPVLWPQLTPGHYAFISHSAFTSLTGPPGVRHNSFAAQPPDLLLRFYVYPLGFGLMYTLAYRLASYPVSVRRLVGFATPLPPLLSLLTAACGSLRLAVTTRGGTFTCKNCAMPGTLTKTRCSPRLLFRKTAWQNGPSGYLSGGREGMRFAHPSAPAWAEDTPPRA